jgi:hypothetical protein
MPSEKRKLALSKETLRTLSATALSQVAGGACYASQYCADTSGPACGGTRTYRYGTAEWVCGPPECQTANQCGGGGWSSYTCNGCPPDYSTPGQNTCWLTCVGC